MQYVVSDMYMYTQTYASTCTIHTCLSCKHALIFTCTHSFTPHATWAASPSHLLAVQPENSTIEELRNQITLVLGPSIVAVAKWREHLSLVNVSRDFLPGQNLKKLLCAGNSFLPPSLPPSLLPTIPHRVTVSGPGGDTSSEIRVGTLRSTCMYM